MDVFNGTQVTAFIILGFPGLKKLKVLLFILGFLAYVLTLLGNILIILMIRKDRRLHSPMYFFLANISVFEICYTSNIVPQMLVTFLTEVSTISYAGCIAQLFIFICLGSGECLILAIMAFDRYFAICRPLHYLTIMNYSTCVSLIMGVWLAAIVVNLPPLISICHLQFCASNIVNHFFCDSPPLLKLSCTDTHLVELINFVVAASVIMSSFSLIMLSYALIIITILGMPTTGGRKKAFSTCASHLTVVGIFFGSLIVMYVRPNYNNSFEYTKVVSVFYTMVTPMLNPFIYSFRNRDMKNALIIFFHA